MNEILDSERSYDGNQGPSLEELRANGYRFEISRYFNVGWSAMKPEIGMYILYTVVLMVILVISSFIPFAQLLIQVPLTAGFFVYGRRVLLGEKADFGDFFGGFKQFGQLLLYNILVLVLTVALIFPIFLISGISILSLTAIFEDPENAAPALLAVMGPVIILFAVIAVLVQALFFFSVPLIVIGKLSAISAISWSVKLALKNILWIVLFMFVLGIIVGAGAIVCGVGLLFTIPLGQCIILGAYSEIVGLGEKRD